MSLIPVSDLIRRLSERGVECVALQFPAGLARQAPEVAAALRDAGFWVIISGDPCYGACDLALDTLAHADVLVHFGHAPLEERPDVIYEPVRIDFDVSVLSRALPVLESRRIGLVTTVQHVHLVSAMVAYLAEHGIEAVVAPGDRRTPLPGQVLGCNFAAARATGRDEILFVGTGVFHPTGIQLATRSRVVALDPFTGEARTVDASRLVRRRAAVMAKADGAGSFGIIVSTKSGQQRMALARRLAALSDRAVLVAMREVSPAGMLDLGFGAYVNTACPRLAYDDQIRFPVPVLTPPEFEILCGVRAWEDYAIDEYLSP
ncbi:MAG TPA: diphthamide biosynthesis enzyme Dph2 [Candidatus Methanoculleus thermohydrogenotrophicum]|nr:diphthamide biosynthesis enzyme Dph2 [Candidatus Methanoculleus thermohydrogenotrophicum]NLM82668.1 diphthamide biosynthesis enzyme Dph2 [Candidatus Methanoculleus thermohydrogenotrophicum]HOB17720.1 diphthamide biosynthesis enzyme Dph2 [Candidatus Methanoculleus thermohydrogenotrophicum]HPZ37923.1 diphthamide biosynthesis enzyme Dph2 [Candidatus Methanoculleus thermohydrogenotrophicum]HQC91107.1 diphthamide biosynthesis enzyme Dph2 [Candidatus Methanoculleus thermohydrogenotrophicum]